MKDRDINFRAWSGKRMIQWNFLLVETVSDWFNRGYEIMQFTGKLDSKGKEIYEGDFVKGYFYVGIGKPIRGTFEVVYNDVWCSFGIELDASFVTIGNAEIEVIGNVYENPELL